MTLWNIIRDWFVINIWGGYTSEDILYLNTIGKILRDDAGEEDYFLGTTDDLFFKVGQHIYVTDYISIGDWLSTTSTIIVLIALCFFFFLMVRWLFRLTSGLIHGRG